VTQIRVEPEALAAVGRSMQPFPSRLGEVHRELVTLRGSVDRVGDAAAVQASAEFLRRLAMLVDIAGLTTAGLVRAVDQASNEYATADAGVVRFTGR
jgi:hypothetical protein